MCATSYRTLRKTCDSAFFSRFRIESKRTFARRAPRPGVETLNKRMCHTNNAPCCIYGSWNILDTWFCLAFFFYRASNTHIKVTNWNAVDCDPGRESRAGTGCYGHLLRAPKLSRPIFLFFHTRPFWNRRTSALMASFLIGTIISNARWGKTYSSNIVSSWIRRAY